MPPSTDSVRAYFLVALSRFSAPSQAPLFGLGIEVCPAFNVMLSLRIGREVTGLKLVVAVPGHAFLLKLVDLPLIFFNLFQYPSMQMFSRASHASDLKTQSAFRAEYRKPCRPPSEGRCASVKVSKVAG